MPKLLNTIEFRRPPAGFSPQVLGVLASECSGQEHVGFSVPAHVMGTLNVVHEGGLWLERERLPDRFATGAQTRSRRYVIAPGTRLLTLFCRADALQALSGQPPAQLRDRWVSPETVFPAWPAKAGLLAKASLLAKTSSWPEIADVMLACVGPESLDERQAPHARQRTDPLQRAVIALHEQFDAGLDEVCHRLNIGERSLQRLFQSRWGVTPKLVQRLLRIQRTVERWQHAPDSLADLAAAMGLSDQAHLAREFRELVGTAPRALKRGTPQHADDDEADPLWALRTGAAHLLPLLLSDTSKTQR